MADPLGLLDDLGVPRGLASGDLAALRAWLARKGPRERGPAADAALAASPAGDGAGPDLARVLAVIDLWIDAHGGTIAARAADLPPPAAGAASAFGARFSDALAAALERAWPAEVALGERDAGRLVSLYRRYFLDPYAPHNLARRSGPASPGDLRALVRASLTTPFGAPSGVASGLWAAAAPLSLRTALALWLIAPPEHGLTRAQAARRQAPGRHPRGSGDPRDRPARGPPPSPACGAAARIPPPRWTTRPTARGWSPASSCGRALCGWWTEGSDRYSALGASFGRSTPNTSCLSSKNRRAEAFTWAAVTRATVASTSIVARGSSPK